MSEAVALASPAAAAAAPRQQAPVSKNANLRRSTSISSLRPRRRTRSSVSENAMVEDAVPPDEDAARWAELVRQRRASRRRKNEEDDQVLVGTRISEGHQNWVVAYNMLTGIRVSTSRCNAKLDRALTDADFAARHKLTFDLAGNELTPSARYDFKFKDYAPWVFRHLRSIFHIDPADYLVSLTGKYILSELGSPGKSGSFFYFSRDYRFIIKTLRPAEHRFLRSILKDYYQHVRSNPNTMISQFYGLHRVKTRFGKRIHFVVMNNLFPPHMDIHATFDLKGSTVGRFLQDDGSTANVRGTMKDLNWMQRGDRLRLAPRQRDVFLKQIADDVAMLARLNIMDYSLLLGVHNERQAPAAPVAQQHECRSPTTERPERGAPLVRTPSVSGQPYRHRDLRRMVTPHQGPVTLSQLAAASSPAAANGTATVRASVQPNISTVNESDSPAISEGMRSNIFYQYEGGIHSCRDDGSPGAEIYYLGIIDLLTTYGTRKRLENFVRGLGHGSDFKKQISAVPPAVYAKRFRDFVSGMTKSLQELAHGAQQRTPSMVNLEAARRELEREGVPLAGDGSTDRVLKNIERPDGTILPTVEHADADGPAAADSTGQSRVAAPAPNTDAGHASNGEDSGVANSLDCLPEESEPSHDTSTSASSDPRDHTPATGLAPSLPRGEDHKAMSAALALLHPYEDEGFAELR